MSNSDSELNEDEELLFLVRDTIDYIKTGYRRKNHGDFKIKGLENERENNTTPEYKAEKLAAIAEEIANCKRCPLHIKRLNPVAGEGDPDADIMFIGEGPGEMEDIKGRPFVGRAGKLLTKMLAAINLTREEVFITNIVKCRPPNNRTPLPDEIEACFPYLDRQIEIIQPIIICCLGGPAIKTILGVNQGISKLRGNIYRYKNIPVIPTYHPAAVLRFPDKYKRPVWNDLKMLRDLYKDLKSGM